MRNFLKNWNGVTLTLMLFALVATPALIPTPSYAIDSTTVSPTNTDTVGSQNTDTFGSQNTNTFSSGGDSRTLINPLGSKVSNFCQLIKLVLEAAVVIGIPIAILFLVWAGFKFVLAQGRPEALAESRRNFLNVIIGIGIFVGASLITTVIINTLQNLGVSSISSCSI